MITFNNSVTNINQTPGIISAPTAEQPAANQVLLGTIFINTTTGAILQSNGATWYSIGGGGSTPGIDSVLAVAQKLTDNRTIDANNNEFKIWDTNNPNANKIEFTSSDLQIGSPNVYGAIVADGIGISVRTLGSVTGLLLNPITANYNFGDEQYFLQVDAAAQTIQTFLNGDKMGFVLDFSLLTFTFGDYNNIGNGTQISVDDTAQQITFDTDNLVFSGTPLLTTSNGTAVNQHLKLTINGVAYQIQLRLQ